MILDIREQKEEKITGIKFDSTGDTIVIDNNYLMFLGEESNRAIILCSFYQLDNFIAACKKAKELST